MESTSSCYVDAHTDFQKQHLCVNILKNILLLCFDK